MHGQTLLGNFPFLAFGFGVLGFLSALLTILSHILNGDSKVLMVASTIMMIVAIAVLANDNFWLRRRLNQDKRLKTLDFEKLLEAKPLIQNAVSEILVTHFSEEVPQEKYIGLHLNKLDDGVRIRRVVQDSMAQGARFKKWLKRYEKKPGYAEYRLEGYRFPFDFMIVDQRIVLFNMTSLAGNRRYDECRLIEDVDLARLFTVVFEILREQAKVHKETSP